MIPFIIYNAIFWFKCYNNKGTDFFFFFQKLIDGLKRGLDGDNLCQHGDHVETQEEIKTII